MIKDILQQLAPLDEKIAALRGDPADENMTDITNHAAELAELSAQEDALLSGCGALTAEDRVFLARHPERPHIDEIVDAPVSYTHLDVYKRQTSSWGSASARSSSITTSLPSVLPPAPAWTCPARPTLCSRCV